MLELEKKYKASIQHDKYLLFPFRTPSRPAPHSFYAAGIPGSATQRTRGPHPTCNRVHRVTDRAFFFPIQLERLQNVSRPTPQQRLSLSLSPVQHYHHRRPLLQQPEPVQDQPPQPEFTEEDQRRSSLLEQEADKGNGKQPQQSISDDEQQLAKTEGTKTVDVVAEKDSIPDEESICQSPTWEGYKEAGKKKKAKEKQKKKQEKEQASKEKFAKKRLTARLSKVTQSQEPSPAPINRKLLRPSSEPSEIQDAQEKGGDAQHALVRLTGQPYVPSGKRPPSRGTNSFVGGVKLTSQSEETVKNVSETREKAIERYSTAAMDPNAVKPQAFSITAGSLPRFLRKTPINSPGALKKEKGKDNGKDTEDDRLVDREAMKIDNTFHRNKVGGSNSMTAAQNKEDVLHEPNSNHVVPHNNMSTPALSQHLSAASFVDNRSGPKSTEDDGCVRRTPQQSLERAANGFKGDHKLFRLLSRFRSSSKRTRLREPPALISTPALTTHSEARPVSRAHSHLDLNLTDDANTYWESPRAASTPPTISERSSKIALPRLATSPRAQLSPGKDTPSPTVSFPSNTTAHFEHHNLAEKLFDAPESTEQTSVEREAAKTSPERRKAPPTLMNVINEATSSAENKTQGSVKSQPEMPTSEISSSSSFAESHEVSPPISPATTPNTSRPQSQNSGVTAQVGGLTRHTAAASAVPTTDEQGLFEALRATNLDLSLGEHKSNTSNKTLKDSQDDHSDQHQQNATKGGPKICLNDSSNNFGTSLPQHSTTSSEPGSTLSHFEYPQDSAVVSPQEGMATSSTTPTSTHQASQSQQDISFLPHLKHQCLGPPCKAKTGAKPESRIFPVISAPQGNDHPRFMSPASSGAPRSETLPSDEGSETSSSPACYLQEARKSTLAPPPPPHPPSQLAAVKPVSHLRNGLQQRHGGGSGASGLRPSSLTVQAIIPVPKKATTATTVMKTSQQVTGDAGPVPDKPIAKMFVECCKCKFFHDMPSKVYECLVTPDTIVEDKRLGVSGAITTMVKCPWCAHNMRRDCCAGYMALVILQQRLH